MALSITEGYAEVMRLGPFGFDAQSSLEAVYSSNVEGEREDPDEDQPDREDYFFVASLSLMSQASLSPHTAITLDTGISVEEHLNRDDLNNSSKPFGSFLASSSTEIGHSTFSLNAGYLRTSESAENVFVPGNRKTRDESELIDYGAEWNWAWSDLLLGASYTFSQERHDDEEFEEGDEDETTINFESEWIIFPRLSLSYDYERQKTEFPSQGDEVDSTNVVVVLEEEEPDPAEDDWMETHVIGAKVMLLRRPSLSYTMAYEKEDETGEKGEWEVTHSIDLSDEWELLSSRRLTLTVDATYNFEKEEEEENDIDFTYGAVLTHYFSESTKHSFSATKEPKETFGSTADTDSTTFRYEFSAADILLAGLRISFGVQHDHDDPLDGESETEKTWTYDGRIQHSRSLTRKLERTFEYLYSYEDSNTESEILEEHRVTLGLTYTF